MLNSKLTYFLLLATLSSLTACSNLHLGDIDETPDEREEMPGPGVFSDAQGEPVLQWSSDNSEALDEDEEFELFKLWRSMRAKGDESPEYQEFRLWLEYRQLTNQ